MMRTTSLICLTLLLFVATPLRADEPLATRAAQRQQTLARAIKNVLPAYAFIGGGGSGVVISEDGYILTNDHVAGNAWVHRIRTMDGKARIADMIGTDPLGDVCLLKVRGVGDEKLAYLPLGDANKLDVGEMVIAIGNPFGMGNVDERPTVTVGIVSTLHRFQNNYTDAIMTDAPINPGNSGGPLITMSGKLVGINGQMVTRFGVRANSGVGYAITINQIKHFLDQLKSANGGYVHHGTISGLRMPPPQANVRPPRVLAVRQGGHAAKCGFAVGDEILEVNGQKTITVTRFYGILGTYPAGTTLEVIVRRGGQSVTLKARLQKRGLGGAAALRATLAGAAFAGGRGAAQSMTVSALAPNGPAARAKVLAGDHLVSVAGIDVAAMIRQSRNPAVLDQLIAGRTRAGGSLMELTVMRKGQKVRLVLDLARGTRSLGLTLGKISAATDLSAAQLRDRDLRLIELIAGSGLARGGLQVGDVLSGIAGRKLKSFADYLKAVRRLRPGWAVPIEYRRNGKMYKTRAVVDLLRRR